ncbi:hypothetical protein IPG41_03010 [Candidatus Peregrinibacteria bacterium]|nr:MAG: hypothetical protein IPG41_03010 [Candidatus Peregrinibacteria bacterium]
MKKGPGKDVDVEEIDDNLGLVLSLEQLIGFFQNAGLSPDGSERLFRTSLEGILQLTWKDFGKIPAVQSVSMGSGDRKLSKLITAIFAQKKALGRPYDWRQEALQVLADFNPARYVDEDVCTLGAVNINRGVV